MAKVARKIHIVPVGDKVLIKPEPETDQKTASGIIIPDTAQKEDRQKGVVMAVGGGEFRDGQLVPLYVKVGDTVLFRAGEWDKEKINDEDHYIVSQSSIIGIIK
jgi:chaperonin GroES